MEENKKPKMKLWKKVLIGIFAIFIISKIIAWGNSPAISADEINKIMSENEKLKEENKKLKEDFEAAKSTIKMYVDKEIDAEKKEEPKNEEPKKEETNKNVSREYQNALKTAESYLQTFPFSKQGLLEQLTSEHGSKFPQDAAQYAIDNLKVDYKEQALKSAKNYMDTMPMSNDELYEQLTSEHGEKFTPEEAQYAIDNLDK
ncbi:Ltp family lipoprotein [Anaerococcus hydrogenalis]|uniref:Ltp family lipoprotein n=1 Tax=Anaerococcus hydrogenalis TaxID=33029 RepID=UPI0029050340|nr:Ltp family lipoprotein [Anaerococcus hydrogenalis]MDU1315674.1 Ltp family lipoprotein [Anaerococcus hydrogenalis]